MRGIQSLLQRKRQRGATMVEYAIMVAVFAVFLIGAVIVMRNAVETGFVDVCEAIADGIDEEIDCTPAE